MHYEDTEKRQKFMNREVDPHQTWNLLVPWSWAPIFRTGRNKFLQSLWYSITVAQMEEDPWVITNQL